MDLGLDTDLFVNVGTIKNIVIESLIYYLLV